MMDDDDDGPWGCRPKVVPLWARIAFVAGYLFTLAILIGVIFGCGFAFYHMLLALSGR